MSSFTNIKKSTDPSVNYWELNPHVIYITPFNQLYENDSKNKSQSSKDMWCITWLNDSDEEVNKYYRLSKKERLEVCKSFNSKFDENDDLIKECIEKYPYLLLTADELAYKMQKDQLVELSIYLNSLPINEDTVELLVKLKAQMPKIFADFEKVEKQFMKQKGESRVRGGRNETIREKNLIIPEDD